ncbi:MAG: hypothetical protein ACD_42C00270G0003 [uncultured bacterium]|nr:MAG: hypothetical protein ACD_42C00270G0003 [uncultured bacterium]OGT33934.1 MAG: nicotinate phosphoribosyltransferase [Gammaproteobacteria bacterium RIFCSPHIGHO2_02_FULL_39_13]OGT50184.1 MAG: nicotinate phosphoribosyltransferase [Gammaproteobacteria bacterium RIFCSPHIGHO2_12_FULL_39_24]
MRNSALLTDFYQYTMAYGYWQLGMHHQETIFHLFFRRNPLRGDYVVANGLENVIQFLKTFQITQEDIDYLASINHINFSVDFLNYLKTLRFTGDIDAVPEGSVVFANEPLLRIKAPIILCQLLETPLINMLNFSSAVATLASRMRTAVGNDVIFEFGLRRAQGPDGGITASRAAYLGGFDATSNVLAGQYFHIPVVGTMSHSWIMAFENEMIAFEEYARIMPNNVILLVDTYDTAMGIEHVIAVAKKFKKYGARLQGVRLDSGELATLTRLARQQLNHAGLEDTKIYVSGDLSEERIADLKCVNAPIDGWGVGTNISTSYDQPALDMVYKLSAIHKNGKWRYKLKRSDNRIKTSDPGMLQVKRYFQDKKWLRDIIYHEGFGITEKINSLKERSCDLLLPIFRDGNCVYSIPTLASSRTYCMEQVKQFNASKNTGYSVQRDSQLAAMKQQLMDATHDE